MKTWGPMAVVLCLIWGLAFFSMRAGNPTAINAVVGIPLGVLFGGSFFWALTREVKR